MKERKYAKTHNRTRLVAGRATSLVVVCALVMTILIVACGGRTRVCGADDGTSSGTDYDALIRGICAYELEQASCTAEALPETLIAEAGTSAADWTFLLLTESEEIAGMPSTATARMAYTTALTEALNATEGVTRSATDLERMALVYTACGQEEEWCIEVARTMAGRNGIMSRIYACFVYGAVVGQNEDCADPELEEELCEDLTALANEDGGFGLTEGITDPDVTAMAVRALMGMPGATEDPELQALCRTAMTAIDRMTDEDGLYQSYGVANAESTAQVVMALASLGERAEAEELMEKLLAAFLCENGGVAHTRGQEANALATLQVWEAGLVLRGTAAGTATETDDTASALTGGEERLIAEIRSLSGMQLRLILTGGLVLLLFIAYVRWILQGLKRPQRYLAAFGLVALLTGILFVIPVENPTEYRERMAAQEGSTETTLSILGPGDEILLEETSVLMGEGKSVFDQLLSACAAADIPVSYTGSRLFANIYVQSIASYAERDYGATSGWMYSVNGETPQIGASAYVLSEGDAVIWYYTDGEEEP